MIKKYLFFLLCLLQFGCGFHPQGIVPLAPPLHRLYIQTSDPYSELVRSIKLSLKMSAVQIVDSPSAANTILVIQQDTVGEEMLSVGTTLQTRQYILRATVVFEIQDNLGRILVPPGTLVETRTITVQSNQVLGTTNEMNLFFKQMRRALAYALMNRIASNDITDILNKSSMSKSS